MGNPFGYGLYGVDAKGYHYQATVCIPDGASCYVVNITIDMDGKLSYELARLNNK